MIKIALNFKFLILANFSTVVEKEIIIKNKFNIFMTSKNRYSFITIINYLEVSF